MLCYNGKLALWCFIGSSCLVSLLYLPNVIYDYVPEVWGAMFWGPLLYYIVINLTLRLIIKNEPYQIAVRATFLGYVFAMGVFVWVLCGPGIRTFGIYICVMSLFHFSEFIAIALINPKSLTVDSFVINHSLEYAVAAISSWIEFFIEYHFFPELKQFEWISLIGLCICIGGEILRKLAMITAESNFHHVVQSTKSENHVLVKHGVYKFCRHPSYVGWFYWSIGTQIILLNPICIVAYAIASWKFFSERVLYEEIMLLNFFGEQYYEYQQKVPTGLPFIKGYRLQL
ncbi:protein-S-isoprenylcysteine O-methyltransferase isoform X2 [Chrysoperla carnea]|uniref:protein-S-isoprenylcysteine O-methyltransferase isoform X2 n=1 Tax=Chrysoperla carnea TaxID=189513 RepID=UPI001D078481|nr:protein-S-isoprenylcysteine O-methyltransferase isoform X2 [Chrysoperla carnea]